MLAASIQNGLAYVEYQRNRLEQAARHATEAAEVAEQRNDTCNAIVAYLILARIETATNQFDLALKD